MSCVIKRMRFLQTIFIGLALCLAIPARADRLADADALYGDLLSRFVRNGRVDYRGLKAARKDLDACREAYAAISEREFEGWIVPTRLAYLSNVYNLTVLEIIADDYPIARIQKAGGWFSGDPFEWPSVSLFGRSISLKILLENYIRRDYAMPLAYFALCQGARGSPPLRAEPYTGTRYYEQVADQAKLFLRSPAHNRLDADRGKLYLSPLFRWYASDFRREAKSVEAFVRKVSPEEWGLRDSPKKLSVSYGKFDWRLNDATTSKK